MTSEIDDRLRAGSTLGFHAIPLYAAIAINRILAGPSVAPMPSYLKRHEVYAFLRQRVRRRIKATIQNISLYGSDLAMAAAAFCLASVMRLGLDGEIADTNMFGSIFSVAPWFVLTCAIIFPLTCLYSRNWRYASVADIFGIVRAVCVASLAFVFFLFVVTRLDAIPRSLMVIDALILIPLLVLMRVRFKIAEMRRFGPASRVSSKSFEGMVPVLLIGAGDSADLYLRALQRDETARHWPVGLLAKCEVREGGNRLRGVPILGSIADFEAVIADLDARGVRPRHLIFTDKVFGFADPDLEVLINCADRLGIAISRPAPILELRRPQRENRFELRPIELTDLLDRPQTALDKKALSRMIGGSRVLVTGAGGSIGGELTLQAAALGPSEIVVLDSCEYNLYAIDMELSEKYPDIRRKAYLCNVRDPARLAEIFDRHRPELVFHAAALKHVPMVELNPCEGVLTNVIGTMNVADATRRFGARAMVQISTDKVVNTTNVMGATKRLAELYCQALDLAFASGDSPVRLMTVRFGNVLGSSGSLIPLFERQLARGGPLTVTDPEMRRFFMTIREAVELTLQASAYGLEKRLGQGEIFVLDMGEPIKIIDMARRMIKLAGYRPDEDIKIKIVGCRPGEKLFEELFDDSERRVSSPIPGVLGAVSNPVPLSDLQTAFALLRRLARQGDTQGVVDLIAEVLPSYRRQERISPEIPATQIAVLPPLVSAGRKSLRPRSRRPGSTRHAPPAAPILPTALQ